MPGFPLSRDRRDGNAYLITNSRNMQLSENAGATGGVNRLKTHRRDGSLRVTLAWPALPEHIQDAILALVGPFAE